MKKLLVLASVAFFAACNSGSDTAKVEAMSGGDTTKMDNTNYPYTADYSHNFEIGSTKNAMTLLQLYKDWDNNTLDNSKNSFADNDTMYFADGTMLAGSRDSVFSVANKMRGQIASVVDSIHAWIPLTSKDKNEDWVAIWTREIATDAKGKKTAQEFHEIWRFDKDGKINLMYQYNQQPPKMPPPPPAPKK
jgi:hypothetical protein